MEKSTALKEIAKGGSIIFMGYILLGGFEFLYKVVVARFLSPSGYGLLSLGFGVIGFAVTISRLGFFQAFQKFIPEYRTKYAPQNIKGLIFFGFSTTLVIGLLFAVCVYILSDDISVTFFDTQELAQVLRIFSFVIPFFAVLHLFFGLFLSFKRSTERVVLDAVGRGGLPLLLTGAAILLGGDLIDVCYMYLLSYIISVIGGAIISETRIFPVINQKHRKTEYTRIISFSLPLLLVGVLREVMHWSDTFLIGFFMGEYPVGVYNSAHPLASVLLLAIFSLNSLFYPVASELRARGSTQHLRDVYLSVTRWIFMLTFPLFLLFIFFSKDFIFFLFGEEYVQAQYALRILCVGTFVNAFFGAVGILLQIHEKQNFIFKVHIIAAVLNVVLNLLLIPRYGIEGAAAATSTAMVFWNVLYYVKVRSILSVQYDLHYYKKYLFAAFLSLLPFFVVNQIFASFSGLLLGAFLYVIVYFFVLVITKAFSSEDIEILLLFEKKTGLQLTIIKKIIKRASK